MPKRIQRKRTKGWIMPENTVYVGRPTKWGNPWSADKYGAEYAVNYYKCAILNWATEWEGDALLVSFKPPKVDEIRAELRGKDLACWCSLEDMCHADVLLEIANA